MSIITERYKMKSLLFSKVTTINGFLYILWADYFGHIAAYTCIALKMIYIYKRILLCMQSGSLSFVLRMF